MFVLAGDEIEVYWTLTFVQPDGKEFEERLWWPGRIESESVHDEDGSDVVVHRVSYEAFRGFDAELREVVFLDDHLLHSLPDGAFMVWRWKGDKWDQADRVLAGVDGDQLLSVHELEQQAQEASAQQDVMTEEEALSHLRGVVPPQQMMEGARLFSDFVSGLVRQVKDAAQAVGVDEDGHVVVTKEIVEAFVQQAGVQLGSGGPC